LENALLDEGVDLDPKPYDDIDTDTNHDGVDDDHPMNGIETDPKDNNKNKPAAKPKPRPLKQMRIPNTAGTILVTLLSQPPYTHWALPKLATKPPPLCPGTRLPQPRYTLLRSFKFYPEVYEGYAHRRTIGWKEGLSKSRNEEIVGRKGEARTWEFGRREGIVGSGSAPSGRGRGRDVDEDEEEEDNQENRRKVRGGAPSAYAGGNGGKLGGKGKGRGSTTPGLPSGSGELGITSESIDESRLGPSTSRGSRAKGKGKSSVMPVGGAYSGANNPIDDDPDRVTKAEKRATAGLGNKRKISGRNGKGKQYDKENEKKKKGKKAATGSNEIKVDASKRRRVE
jgi:hypothetical protein